MRCFVYQSSTDRDLAVQVEQLPENVRHPSVTVSTQRKLLLVSINRASKPITLCVSCHTASFVYSCSSPAAPGCSSCKFRRQTTHVVCLLNPSCGYTPGSAHVRSKAQRALQFLPNSKLCTLLLLSMLAVQKEHMH